MSSSKLTSRRQFLKSSAGFAAMVTLAACAPQTAGVQSDAGSQEVATGTQAGSEAMLSTELSEPVRFSYLRPVWGPATHEKGSAYEQELFERANVEIDSQIVPVFDYETKLPVMVAGGNLPDVMWHAGPQWGTAYDLIQQGAFLPLDPYLEKYPAVKEAISQDLWDKVESPDGNHYFFPMPLSPFVPFPIYYRKDVFDELGLEEPETIDEFVEALKVIRDETDLIPITAHEYSIWYFQNVGPAFGYAFGNWVPDPADPNPENPERIVPSRVTQAYKDFLLWLQMLRQEELIDPDYLIATGEKGVDKFTAGQAATMVGHWGGYPDWVAELRKTEPDAEVAFMGALEGPAGPMGSVALNGFDRGFSIAASAEDKADDIFKFLNWVYTEGYDFMRWGVEGEMYTVDDEGNKITIADTERDPGFQRPNVEPFGFPLKSANTLPNLGQDWEDLYDLYKERGLEDRADEAKAMFETMAENAMPNYRSVTTFSPTEAEKGAQLWQQYLKPMEEKFAIDPTLPESAFDEAVDAWLANGGAQIIEEVNAAQEDKSRPTVEYNYQGRDLPQE